MKAGDRVRLTEAGREMCQVAGMTATTGVVKKLDLTRARVWVKRDVLRPEILAPHRGAAYPIHFWEIDEPKP